MRKATQVVHVSLRMREALRRKLEAEASRKLISLNNEIINRLELTFDAESKLKLSEIGEDIAFHWNAWKRSLRERDQQADLILAAESLIAHPLIKSIKGETVEFLIANLRRAIDAVDEEAKKRVRRVHVHQKEDTGEGE